METLQRLLSLGMDKIRAAEVVAEDVVLTIIDSVMNTAIDFHQTSQRPLPYNTLLTVL